MSNRDLRAPRWLIQPLAKKAVSSTPITSGGGWILMPAPHAHHHSFGFTLSSAGDGFHMNLQYVDHHPAGQEGGGFTVHFDGPVEVCKRPDGTVEVSGLGATRKPQTKSRRGTGAVSVGFTVRFKDSGEPGSVPVGPDQFHFEIPADGYSSGPDAIDGGNIQAQDLDLISVTCVP